MRAFASLLTIAAALALLAGVSNQRAAGGPHLADRHPPPVRSQDMLRRSGGVVWWVTSDCRLTRLRMATLAVSRADGRYCRAWPAPDSSVVLAATGTGPTLSPPGRLVAISGRSLRPVAQTPVRGDLVAGPVAWSPDSLLALACVSGRSLHDSIEVLSSPWQRVDTVRGRCRPAVTASSATLTSDGRSIFQNGHRLHLDTRLAGALGVAPGRYAVTALAASPGGLVAAVRTNPNGGFAGHVRGAVVAFDLRSGRAITLVAPHGASELNVSPSGDALWYRDAATGRAVLKPLVAGGVTAGLPRTARAYAWSPDGRYAAAALGDHILVLDTRTGATGRLEARQVTSLSWTR